MVVEPNTDLLYSAMDYGGDMRDKYTPLDIPVLFATMYCPEYAPEKLDEKPDSIASRYQDIQDVGRIFQVADRAQDLVEKMRNRVESVSDQTNENKPQVARLTFYDNVARPMSVTAGNSLGNQMIEVAGGTNVYNDLEGSSTDEVNAESLIDRDPDIIAIRLHSSGPDFDTIRNYLRQDERFKDISAVQNDRFTKIYNSEHFAGIRFPDAIDRLAEAFSE